MNITYIDIIGILGGILVIICLIPQLLKIIKRKSAKDVSLIMYIILFIAQVLWATYGFLKNDLQVIITNVISAFISLLIIGISLYYDTKEKKVNVETDDNVSI